MSRAVGQPASNGAATPVTQAIIQPRKRDCRFMLDPRMLHLESDSIYDKNRAVTTSHLALGWAPARSIDAVAGIRGIDMAHPGLHRIASARFVLPGLLW